MDTVDGMDGEGGGPQGRAAARRCPHCDGPLVRPLEVVCDPCIRRFPPSLLKAVGDSFDYALRLRTGETLRFGSATLYGDYVHISGGGYTETGTVEGARYPCPRGLDVRLADIVWCADAPEGS